MGVLPDWMIRNEEIISENFSEAMDRPGQLSYGNGSYGYTVRIGYKFKVFKAYPAGIIDPKKFDPKLLEEVDLTPPRECPDCKSYLNFYQPYPHNEAWFTCSMCDWTKPIKEYPDHIIIPPHSFVLGESVERFNIPRGVLCICVGKSTYARCGIIVNVTPLEPEWRGVVTIEISNTTPLPAKIYCGEGIMQAIFLRSDSYYLTFRSVAIIDEKGAFAGSTVPGSPTCEKSYADKKGRYQDQTQITLPTTDSQHGQ